MPATSYERYVGNPAENYERYFVPAIGLAAARPLVDAAALKAGERVLDLACGTGVVARLAAAVVGPGGAVVGVDPTPPMLEVARAVAPADVPTEWHQASAEDLPLEEQSFDAVVCAQGFQFFADKPAALAEMRRVLVPDGRTVLGTPGPTPPPFEAIGEALAEHVGPEAAGFVHAVFSVHDPGEVREQLEAAGFQRVDVETGSLPLRLAPPAEFLWQYLCSTPLVMMVAPLDDPAKAALESDVVRRCEPFLDGDALVMEPGYLMATAYRS